MIKRPQDLEKKETKPTVAKKQAKPKAEAKPKATGKKAKAKGKAKTAKVKRGKSKEDSDDSLDGFICDDDDAPKKKAKTVKKR